MILHDRKLIFIHIIKTGGTSIEKLFNSPPSDHRRGRDYLELLGAEKYQQYFSFAIVRNPWDKMVSQYFFNAHKWNPENTSFKEYIKKFGKGERISKYSPFHFSYIMDANEQIIVDYIGRFEKLQDSFNHVCKQVDLNITKLPHYKKSTHGCYRDYYDEESRRIVAKMFEKEIDYFEYKF